MERITFQGKSFQGQKVWSKNVADSETTIYLINTIMDKYLILHRGPQGEVIDFVVTGLDKVYDIQMMLADSSQVDQLRSKVNKALREIRTQSMMRKLDRLDMGKFRDLVGRYYDSHYSAFVALGIRFTDLMAKVEKGMTL